MSGVEIREARFGMVVGRQVEFEQLVTTFRKPCNKVERARLGQSGSPDRLRARVQLPQAHRNRR